MSTRSSGDPVIGAQQTLTTKSGVGPLRIVAKASAPKRHYLEDVSTYQIRNRILDSNWATFFTAVHKVTGQVVCVKFLNPKGPLAEGAGSSASAVWRQQFALETRIMRSMDHPNVVRLLAHGSIPGGRLCLVMPYFSSTLSDELGRDITDDRLIAHLTPENRPRKIHPVRVLNLIRQIASGVGALHKSGIAHGALNPENVLMTSTLGGDPVVSEFGKAKWGEKSLDLDTALLGRSRYESPEQMTDPTHASVTSDVYAIGAIAYRMLTARMPTESENSVLGAGVDVTEPFSRCIQSCLSQRPEDRPTNAHALRAALDDSLSTWQA
ncbi:MAG: protein kinase [Rhodospirillales bacterium]|nr:protein kinase [Rhodospirillales bacterium]MBT4628058.1 protein kinase [Rhodospirillales bacterium]MBT5353233.1 protein kinase [Rhodospirillales bacterium]MBT5522426.1 protein kinase [Rhodospirillales bacterium]MBT6108931.1 protein kinase [Rhodospirillales bacterium]